MTWWLCQVWSTAQSSDIKMRGYLEVRSTLPAKVNGGNLKVECLCSVISWSLWPVSRAPGPPSGCWALAMVTSGRDTGRLTSSRLSMETRGWKETRFELIHRKFLNAHHPIRSWWQSTRPITTEAMASTRVRTLTTLMLTSPRTLSSLVSSGTSGLMWDRWFSDLQKINLKNKCCFKILWWIRTSHFWTF